jgi:hypothetical protein
LHHLRCPMDPSRVNLHPSQAVLDIARIDAGLADTLRAPAAERLTFGLLALLAAGVRPHTHSSSDSSWVSLRLLQGVAAGVVSESRVGARDGQRSGDRRRRGGEPVGLARAGRAGVGPAPGRAAGAMAERAQPGGPRWCAWGGDAARQPGRPARERATRRSSGTIAPSRLSCWTAGPLAGRSAAASASRWTRGGLNSASIAAAISRNVARGCAVRHPRTPPTTAAICCAHRASSASPFVLPIDALRHASGDLTQYRGGHPVVAGGDVRSRSTC